MQLLFHFKTSLINECDDINLIIEEIPGAKPGSLLELSQVIDSNVSKIIVKVPEEIKSVPATKNTIIIPPNLGKKFGMKSKKDVSVKVISNEEKYLLGLDYVEIILKDQYFSRSDMFRIRKSLMDNLIYYKEMVEKLNTKIITEELWREGVQVSCGFVTKDTRVNFRSSTAQIQIFIQMSCEMWHFDNNGQLYFEKAVDGYLNDLFNLWRINKCNHDVTITLFSRTFFKLNSLEDLPAKMKPCVKEDISGRYYEDYYRVVVKNERYENWFQIIDKLKSIFATYDSEVLHYHDSFHQPEVSDKWNPVSAMGNRKRSVSEGMELVSRNLERMEGIKKRDDLRRKSVHNPYNPVFPNSWNSCASEGNFLEVINMALNLYEKFYIDRCFERTGKISLVITPGNGFFVVNNNLRKITLQRSIDIGSSCDIICLGERPLFAVPLFKADKISDENDEDFNVPQWLNLSYYASLNQLESRIQDKIKLDFDLVKKLSCQKSPLKENKFFFVKQKINYEDYDNNIFKYKLEGFHKNKFSHHVINSSKQKPGDRRQRVTLTNASSDWFSDQNHTQSKDNLNKLKNKNEEYLSHTFSGNGEEVGDNSNYHKRLVGSLTHPYAHCKNAFNYSINEGQNKKQNKKFVNPFRPEELKIHTQSNRVRWSHAYPTGLPSLLSNHKNISNKETASPSRESTFSDPSLSHSKAKSSRQHQLSECSENDSASFVESPPRFQSKLDPNHLPDLHPKPFSQAESTSSLASSCNESVAFNRCKSSMSTRTSVPGVTLNQEEVQKFFQSKSGDLEAHLSVYNTMDWKSMTLPPILPITTDFTDIDIQKSYYFAEYSLISEQIDNIFGGVYGSRNTPTMREVYNEMIYQRIARGFQIIIPPQKNSSLKIRRQFSHLNAKSTISKSRFLEDVQLSMGRLFHNISLHEKDIIVRRFFPKHKEDTSLPFDYNYRFKMPDNFYFDSSLTRFKTESLDDYNWNHVDSYLFNQDNVRFVEGMKFWRANFTLLPANNDATRRIQEGVNSKNKNVECNVYQEKTRQERENLINGMMRFVESINKVEKTGQDQGRKKERRGSLGQAFQGDKIRKLDEGESNNNSQQSKINFSPKLTEKSRPREVLEVMKHPTTGLNFIKCNQEWVDLPEFTFISLDAVEWLKKNVEGVTSLQTALVLMNIFINTGLICHVSNKKEIPFINGFKLYYILEEKDRYFEEGRPPLHVDPNVMEVELVLEPEEEPVERRRYTQTYYLLKEINPSNMLKFRKNNPLRPTSDYKYVRLDLEGLNNERQEWGVVKHHRMYNPICALNFSIEWLVASGSSLGDKIATWVRYAARNNLHLVPIPSDSFALPSLKDSDPLRGPIFIPMDVKCLEIDTPDSNMVLNFQDCILKSFGFMREKCVVSPVLSEEFISFKPDDLPKYIHCTGGMMMMVVSENSSNKINHYEEFIKQQNKQSKLPSAGFLWAWNFMLSKKWMNKTTGDDAFQDAILSDLRRFNSNKDGRLKHAWDLFKRKLPITT